VAHDEATVIPLALLPDVVTFETQGPDLGSGPTGVVELLWRCRVQTKTKLIAYADGRTANATDLVIGYPTASDIDGAPVTLTPRIDDKLVGLIWEYGERRVMSVETFRDGAGRVHHHELWVGLA
jgi:hypothetical protein